MVIVIKVILPNVLSIVDLDCLVNTNVDVGHSHHIHCECSGLIRANVVGTAHDLARSKLLHEILIDEHLSHREGKCDHDCKRKSLRDSDDNNGDSDEKISQPLDEVLLEVMLLGVEAWFVTIKIHGALSEFFNEESQEQDVECENSGIHAELSKILTNLL